MGARSESLKVLKTGNAKSNVLDVANCCPFDPSCLICLFVSIWKEFEIVFLNGNSKKYSPSLDALVLIFRNRLCLGFC